MSNVLSEDLAQADDRTMYNEHCKELLSSRQILSRILKATTDEFKDIPLSTIMNCIEGTPEISKQPVFGDTMQNEKIVGSDTVDSKPGEGITTYDVKFITFAPTGNSYVKMYMNIEAQKKLNTEYPLVTRGIYYCARMISSQYGVEFKNSEYGKIKKVYSIWVCMNSTKKNGNTIVKYSINKQDLIGMTQNCKNEYDKMTSIFIHLNQDVKDSCELIGMLNTIFSKKYSIQEKYDILEQVYEITLENKEKEILNDMCNLAEGLIEKTAEEVTEKVTASVTASVTADDIKKTFSILQRTGTDTDTALELISDEYKMSMEDVKNILGL